MPDKKDAIENDVSAEEQTQLVAKARENANGQRLDSMQELAENARERRDADLSEAGHEVVDTTVDPKVDPDAEELAAQKAADEAAEAQKAEETAAKEAEREEMHTLKVDGKDVEVPVSKVLDAGTRALQKESTADARLEEATRLLKDAQANANAQLSTDAGQNTDEMSTPSKDAENLAKTLIEGDLDEVTGAVSKMLGSGRDNATPDHNEIAAVVKDTLSVNTAMALFQKEPGEGGFNDLYKNEKLREMVLDEEKKLFNSGDERSHSERLTDAAKVVRKFRDEMIEGAGGVVASFEERKVKKATAENTIEGTGGRETPKGDLKPKTRAQVRNAALEKMANSRGQQID